MNFWRRNRERERDMQEELESLAAMAEPKELGNLTRAAEDARAQWTWAWFEQLQSDVRYALRSMRHNPGFTATAVFSLALGIGANTAIFSLIDVLMLRWLPVQNPSELVQVKMGTRGAKTASNTFSYAIAGALAEQKDIFSDACGFSGASFNVGPPGSVTQVSGAWVTGGYYPTLGLNPAAGRLLGPADDQPGAPPAAVLSYGYWDRQYARNESIVGSTLRINGIPVTIAGVSPRGFTGASAGTVHDITIAAAILPVLDQSAAVLIQPGNFWMRILARPKPGISVAQAKARLDAAWPGISERVISRGWSADRRKEMAEAMFELAPGGTGYTFLREIFERPLMVLMGVAALVLLIACANVASLLLARAAARRREISVRLAIGAGRGRIIRQLLTESVVLSAVGAAFAIGLSWLSSRFLVNTLSRGPFPVEFDLTPNWHVLAFAIGIALANGLLFGLAPAMQTTAIARAANSRSRMLAVLVSAQVALSLVLLVGAGLFTRTLSNLLARDPGFRREGVLLAEIDGRREGYRDEALRALYRELLGRVRSTPGVSAASVGSHTPLNGSSWSEAVVPKGQTLPKRDNALFIAAGPDFFATIGTPLLSGREFDEHDSGTPRVAIVNQTFAVHHFPGRNPIGEHLTATVTNPPCDLEIVGVVRDSVNAGLRQTPRPTVYVSWLQRAPGSATLLVRASGSLNETASAMRRQIQPSFPTTPVEIHGLEEQVDRTLVQERLLASLAGGFGALGLLLTGVGLFGLLAYTVARRTREIGVRMALGAQPRGVVWMVARRALWLVSLGVVLGLPASWGLSRYVESMLFGVTPTDPGVLAIAAVLLGAAGMVAAYLPARRAARVDPMTALRHE